MMMMMMFDGIAKLTLCCCGCFCCYWMIKMISNLRLNYQLIDNNRNRFGCSCCCCCCYLFFIPFLSSYFFCVCFLNSLQLSRVHPSVMHTFLIVSAFIHASIHDLHAPLLCIFLLLLLLLLLHSSSYLKFLCVFLVLRLFFVDFFFYSACYFSFN